jgi:putative transposase
MPRRTRIGTAGIVHHVLNRANRRDVIFFNDADFEVFQNLLFAATQRFEMPLFAFAIMRNHWHLIVRPSEDVQLSRFMHWLTMTHTQRWHRDHGTSGTGSLYQGRYKSFPVKSDRHFFTVVSYVERNPVRAHLVDRVEDWRWSSAWRAFNNCNRREVESWPVPRPANWFELLNRPQNQIDLCTVRESVTRSAPLGDPRWVRKIAARLGILRATRRRGRPLKEEMTPDPESESEITHGAVAGDDEAEADR